MRFLKWLLRSAFGGAESKRWTAAFSCCLVFQALLPHLPAEGNEPVIELILTQSQAVSGENIAAEVRFLNGESETLIAADSGDFRDLISNSLLTVDIQMDIPRGGIFVGETFHVYGKHDGRPAIEVDGQIFYFESIASAQGSTGDPTGRINGAQVLFDGSVLYLGQSTGTGSNEPTFWFEPQQPFHPLINGQSSSGELRASAADGTIVGTTGFGSAVSGSAFTNSLQSLPGFGATGARDITWNAEFIVGNEFIWYQNELGGYNVLNTNGFDFSESFDSSPTFLGVEVDSNGRGYFVGEFLDVDFDSPTLFQIKTGIWDVSGSLLFSTEGEYSGITYVDGSVVVAVQPFEGEGYLIRPADGASLTVSELVGAPASFAARTSIFSTDGGFGMLLQDADGFFVSLHETSSTPIPGPELVDLWVDSNGDGEFDMFFPETDIANFELMFPSPGTYSVTAVAMNGTEELARVTEQVVVTAYRLEDRDGVSVLVIGANQDTGSTINVRGLNGSRLQVMVDRFRGNNVMADLVEIHGSPRSDRVLLTGGLNVLVEQHGEGNQLLAIGLNSLEVYPAPGDRQRFVRVRELIVHE
jgi:hypothetical protein